MQNETYIEKYCNYCKHNKPVVDSEPCLSCNFGNKQEKIEDKVNQPSYYTQGKTETIDYIQDKLTKEEMIGAMKFNIIKYISRERLKNGLEDVKKAQYYLNKLVTLMEG